MGRKAKWKMENLRFWTKGKPVSPLIYHRTQKLIDLAASGAESGVQYFFPGSGKAFSTGDGSAGIAFFWDMDDAFWQARDLNRIQDWARYLAGLLTKWDYPAQTQSGRKWLDDEIPNRPEIDRIRRDVDALQGAFLPLPDWREILYANSMDWRKANDMEWDLQALETWLGRLEQSQWGAGEIGSAEADGQTTGQG